MSPISSRCDSFIGRSSTAPLRSVSRSCDWGRHNGSVPVQKVILDWTPARAGVIPCQCARIAPSGIRNGSGPFAGGRRMPRASTSRPARVWLSLSAFSFAASLLIAVAPCAYAAPKSAAKPPPDKAFQKAKKDYQLKARQKKPADRIAALKLLEDFPTGDAADLVYVTLLDDKTDSVRQAAVDFITALRDNSEVTDKLLARMISTTRKDGMDIRAISTLRILAVTEDEDLQRNILGYLDEFLGTPQANQLLLHEMIDSEAVSSQTEEVLRLLMLLARAQYFNRDFGYRRCLAQGLMQVKDQEALGNLINLLPLLKGLVQFDVVSHLISATGQNFGADADKWKEWWTKNRGALKAPDKLPPGLPTNYGNFGEYYGIPICAKRIVFVLDTSLSMRGARIDAAKTELIRVIKELPKEVFFDVIAF